MSEYGLALDFLAKQEGGTEHRDAVAAHVKALVDESRERATKLKEATAKLRRLTEVAGGTEEELVQQVEALQKQVKDLTGERDSLKTEKEKETKELESLRAEKVKQEKESKLRSLSEKAGADHDAFVQLFGEMPIELVGETVTVKEGDKNLSLDDYLKEQPAWKRAALFSSKEEEAPGKQGKLPGAPPTAGSGGKEQPTAGDNYIGSRYKLNRFKTPS